MRRVAEWVLLLWERKSNPWQALLLEEEEEEAEVEIPKVLMVDTQMQDEGFQELGWVLGDQEPQIWQASCG